MLAVAAGIYLLSPSQTAGGKAWTLDTWRGSVRRTIVEVCSLWMVLKYSRDDALPIWICEGRGTSVESCLSDQEPFLDVERKSAGTADKGGNDISQVP